MRYLFKKRIRWRKTANETIKMQRSLHPEPTMPIKFLKASGKGFFREKLAIREDLRPIIKERAFYGGSTK